MKVIVLGCGSSGGVPLITGEWGACDPLNPKNRRTRTSVLVQVDGHNILIDTSPDLRHQLLANEISHIDAVLYTHAHADHVFGIDELRQIAVRKRLAAIPCYANRQMCEYLKKTFSYGFHEADPLYPPFLKSVPFDGPFMIGNVRITPYPQQHGHWVSFGFRIDDFAYSTDFSDIPLASLEHLKNLKLWMAGCLRDEPHPNHAHYEQVIDFVRRLRPEQTILTHMTPLLDYAELLGRCPPGVQPAYDGLSIVIP